MGKLVYRSPSAGFWGDLVNSDWPEWVRELAGKSGVYVIRERPAGRVLYVGESHSGRLKKTLLRHFQSWHGQTAGVTYVRAFVEIAVKVTAPGRALAEQDRLICALKPKDNSLSPACELRQNDNPF